MRRDAASTPTPLRTARGTLIVALALLVCASLPAPAGAAGPQDAIGQLVAAVSAVMEDPALQGQAKKGERRERVGAIIHRAFDFERMAQASLGPTWTTLTGEQRAEFTRLFGHRFERSYSLLVLQFLGGRTTTYAGESVDGDRAVVRVLLVSPKDGTLPVEYRLAARGGQWTVEDVVVDGVSLAANYRAQFSRTIRTSSYETLVGRLRKPVE
jgi:phospholipid transport system substrate-binding protein